MRGRPGVEDGKIPWKSGKRQPAALEKEGLLSRKDSSLAIGLEILPDTNSSPDVPSQCILGPRPQSSTAPRGCGGKARSIHGRRERPGKAGAPRGLKWMLFRWATCAVALPVPGSAQRAEPLSSETSSEARKHGARTGLGEGARSSLAQSANYIIGTKKRISLGLVWPSGALWRQLTDVETF